MENNLHKKLIIQKNLFKNNCKEIIEISKVKNNYLKKSKII